MSDRQRTLELIKCAGRSGARVSAACSLLGVSARSVQRWRKEDPGKPDNRKAAAMKRIPKNRLSEEECEKILSICNMPEFSAMPPNQIVPALADQGVYVASESSFYRVLRKNDQAAHRGRSRPPVHKRPETIKADAPNQLWSWDITYLPTTIKGTFFYLYMIMDVYSRKIVGWEVFENENADNSASLIRKTYLREGIAGRPLIVHADNGSPMKGATMLVTLQKLGVIPSFSRPSVSNDNAYSEALFKTLKYHTEYPDKPFSSLECAREWVAGFQRWYNEFHRHSAIKFVTPGQRHRKEDVVVLSHRELLYQASRKKRPERWTGSIRNWDPVEEVFLNSEKSRRNSTESMAA